jgi:hypothetical protein
VSDEHWLPSLLASYGLDNQTDCEVRLGLSSRLCMLCAARQCVV